MSLTKEQKEQKIADCAAGKIATGFRQNGSGGCRIVLYFCNDATCPNCGQYKADELAQRVTTDMAAKGIRKLTRVEVSGNLGTPDGKKLRKKLNKAMRESNVLYTIMPHGDKFIMHIVGSANLDMLDGLVISNERLRAKEIDWFSDCKTTSNKSGTLGKKTPAPASSKPTTKISVPEPKFAPGLSRDQLMDALDKAVKQTADTFAELPTGGNLSDDEKRAVETAYQFRAELMEEAIEEQGGKVVGKMWRTVFYSGNVSKKLSRSDLRELIPIIPNIVNAPTLAGLG